MTAGGQQSLPTVPGTPTGSLGPGYTVPTAADWSEAIPQGIFGPAPELRVEAPVFIADAFVRPSVAARELAYDVWVTNGSPEARTVELSGGLRSASGAAWPYPELPRRVVTVPARSTEKVTVGPVAWRAGPDSYWWPNVPYRAGYRAQLHDLDLRPAEPAHVGSASFRGKGV